MNISYIDLNHKEVIECNEKIWSLFGDYNWHFPLFKFKFLSRKENVFLFEIWKRECISDYGWFGSPYRLGDWKFNVASEFTIPIEAIENSLNYESLLRNEVIPRLLYTIGDKNA